MLSTALRIDIEAHARRIRLSNPFLLRAAEGSLDRDTVGRYVASVGLLTHHTVPHLRKAESVASLKGNSTLASFFAAKLREEHGHVRWTDHDIEVVADVLGRPPEPVPAMRQLMRQVGERIVEDPQLYLAFILWAEYLTVLLGAEVVRHLTTRCGIPVGALTSVANHVELDVDHVHEALDSIDTLVGDPSMVRPMREALAGFTRLFDLACTEMVGLELRAVS